MYRANRVRQSALSMSTYFVDALDCRFHIARIIHGIKHPEYIDSINVCSFTKFFYYVISIVPVAKNILSPK